MKKFLFLSLIIFCFVNISCEKEPADVNPVEENNNTNSNFDLSENFGAEITRTFLGRVIDKNHDPIKDVSIKIGSSSSTTDANGVFIVPDAEVHENFAYITATKPGFTNGSRAVVPSSGTNKVTIMLLEASVTGSVQSGNTETINLSNGASVTLAGEYITENGEQYSGSVDVIMHHLDPAEEDMSLQMPGMLYAANSENEERMLQSYGMLSVELRGSGGEKLNLAEGTIAEIKMPLSPDLLAVAPSTIPLWHFDEEKGYWIEDGEAVLEGNVYVGTVSHFSFWNYDTPFPTVNLCITVLDQNGNPLPNVRVDLFFSNYPFSSVSGHTNGTSMVCGAIPSGEVLDMIIINPSTCQEVLYSATIGPYSNNATENVVVTLPPTSAIINESIVGNFNDCNGNPVINGYVRLKYDGISYIDEVNNGNFNFNLLHCIPGANDFSIEGVDYTSQQTTGIINYTFTSPNTNLGTLISCNSSIEFMQYSIDNGAEIHYGDFDISASFDPMNPDFNAPTISISHFSQTQTTCMYLFGVLNSSSYLGSYDNFVYNPGSLDTGFSMGDCPYMPNPDSMVFNLTYLGNVGEYIDINFSGSFSDNQGNSHTIIGVVHVIRDE